MVGGVNETKMLDITGVSESVEESSSGVMTILTTGALMPDGISSERPDIDIGLDEYDPVPIGVHDPS